MKGLTDATSKDVCVVPKTPARGYQSAGHCLKEREITRLLCQEQMPFFNACIIPFACYGPLGVFSKFNSFLFIYSFIFFKFDFKFFYSFIRSQQVIQNKPLEYAPIWDYLLCICAES